MDHYTNVNDLPWPMTHKFLVDTNTLKKLIANELSSYWFIYTVFLLIKKEIHMVKKQKNIYTERSNNEK